MAKLKQTAAKRIIGYCETYVRVYEPQTECQTEIMMTKRPESYVQLYTEWLTSN